MIERATEREPGAFRVHYALADASHYVQPGSALFEEALARGVSYYVPGLCLPMLPRALSEGIVSLNPEVDRRALIFTITLDAAAQVVGTELARGRIRSRAKLTYDGVQALYDDASRSPLRDQPYTASLELLAEVGRLRIAEARERDVVQFNRTNLEVAITADGRQLTLEREGRNDASRYNEQISLLCNIEGARFLVEGGNPDAQPVYRVHAAPDPRSLEHLERVIRSMVDLHHLDPKLWSWRLAKGAGEHDGHSLGLAAYLDRLASTAVEQAGVRAAIERQVLIANRRSEFTAEPGRHFALGVNPYSRFSSPMREVVGVFTHKEALEKLGLVDPGASPRADEALRARVIRAANRAKERQGRLTKEVNTLALDQLFGEQLAQTTQQRPIYRGTIVGLKPTRIYVTIDEPPMDLKVRVEDLEPQLGKLQLAKRQPALLRSPGKAPDLRLGDPIALRISRRDRRGRWRLALA